MATLVLTKRFREDKELEMQDFIRDLYEDLTFRKLSIDTETLSRHMKSFETNVLGPAVELQQTISCSSTEYYSFEPDRELMQNVRDGDRIWDYTFKDIVEWRDRAPTETCGNMFCLFPGFYRKGMKIADDVILVKPTLLVLNKDTISKLQEYRKVYGSTQNMRQRSPGTDETVPSRGSSLPHGSHSSTARSVNDRQRTYRKRDEFLLGILGAFASRNEKKLNEMPGSEAKTRSHRLTTEERDPRATPPRDAKGKEKRSRRGNPTPASSRKPTLSQSHLEATALPSEHSVGLRSAPVIQDTRYASYPEAGTISSNEKYLPSLPTPGKGGEELGSSHTDSSINEHPILEEAAETRNHAQRMRSTPEISRPVGQSGYTSKAHPHPQEQGFREEQSKLSKSSPPMR
ncbi:hypothetical protein BS50DRAFT_319004 [Corynespora cassiicola Philippines]|uniref:Uncharacterized protein n=1 Tax=Corynespora cassiicola Philippines TaxID=1448308 RepID=A0A2T2NSU1_CORCC|nr:hypothetical protein BS50DRAFT_319004 [Corynespora cassiicola Philippines]